MKFKVGDRVKRIYEEHCGMKIGDTAIVKMIDSMGIYLDKYIGGHSPENLILVKDKKLIKEFGIVKFMKGV